VTRTAAEWREHFRSDPGIAARMAEQVEQSPSVTAEQARLIRNAFATKDETS
jgi:hypothetical protein